MSNEVVNTDTGVVSHGMSREQIELIKRTIAKGATDDELKLFIQVCNRTRLDPFARQIYCIGRWDATQQRNIMQTQVSIDGARLAAERSGKYAGQLGPLWTDDGKEWLDVWLGKEPPRAAKAAVLRSDFKDPLWAVATWDSYCQKKKDGSPTAMWLKMGPLMLGKCAEMLALRKGFPAELSGLYSAEEMDQATPEVEHVEPVADDKPPRLKPTDKAPAAKLREFFDSIKRKFMCDDDQAKLLASGWMHDVGVLEAKKLTVGDLQKMLTKMLEATAAEAPDPFAGDGDEDLQAAFDAAHPVEPGSDV